MMQKRKQERRWRQIGRSLWAISCLFAGLLLGTLLLDRFVMPLVVLHANDTIVPAVEGRSRRDVDQLLRVAELQFGRIQNVPDPIVPVGLVVAQDPPSGSTVRKGRSVNLLISSGAALRQIPDVVGMTLRHARLELGQRGLTPRSIVYLDSPESRPEMVLATRPAAGGTPRSGGEIDLLVSRRPARSVFVMPSLEGWDWHEAAARLRTLGLRVSHWGDEARVAYQEPAAGEPVTSGMTVYLE